MINPLKSLKYIDIKIFENFLNPSKSEFKREEWMKNYQRVFEKYLLSDVNMPMNMKKYFCAFLMLYPFNEIEEKTFLRLNNNGRVGYLSNYLIKKARTCKVPEENINKFIKCKKKCSSYKGSDNNFLVKKELTETTFLMLDWCFSKNTRSSKLDLLLDD